MDLLRINRDKQKDCLCATPTYEVDVANERVTCLECGAIVKDFEVILNMGKNYERVNEIHAAQMAEKEAAQKALWIQEQNLLQEKERFEKERAAFEKEKAAFEKEKSQQPPLIRESRWDRFRGK